MTTEGDTNEPSFMLLATHCINCSQVFSKKLKVCPKCGNELGLVWDKVRYGD